MSTRSNIIVKDDRNCIQLYRHCDGYPCYRSDDKVPFGVVTDLLLAFKKAWPLPRFEADDFSAAIIAAWKDNGGNVYIDGEADPNDLGAKLHGDIEHWYLIEDGEGGITVTHFDVYESTKRSFILNGGMTAEDAAKAWEKAVSEPANVQKGDGDMRPDFVISK